MAKRKCPDGKTWDNLLRTCFNTPTRRLHPPTEPILTVVDNLTAKTSPANSTSSPHVLMLSQTVWISVILVTLGSLLTLIIWLVIFRRQVKACGDSEDPVPEQETLQKVEPIAEFNPPQSDRNGQALQKAANSHSSCPQLPFGAQKDPEWEDSYSICKDPTRHGAKEGARSTVADHRVPLPATELGGTALVTTKTV